MIKMDNPIQSITEKLYKSSIGLPRCEIEKIVLETYQQIIEEEEKELGNTVAMADPD